MSKYSVDYDRCTFKEDDDRGYYINGVFHLGHKNKDGYIVDNIKTKEGVFYKNYIWKWS